MGGYESELLSALPGLSSDGRPSPLHQRPNHPNHPNHPISPTYNTYANDPNYNPLSPSLPFPSSPDSASIFSSHQIHSPTPQSPLSSTNDQNNIDLDVLFYLSVRSDQETKKLPVRVCDVDKDPRVLAHSFLLSMGVIHPRTEQIELLATTIQSQLNQHTTTTTTPSLLNSDPSSSPSSPASVKNNNSGSVGSENSSPSHPKAIRDAHIVLNNQSYGYMHIYAEQDAQAQALDFCLSRHIVIDELMQACFWRVIRVIG